MSNATTVTILGLLAVGIGAVAGTAFPSPSPPVIEAERLSVDVGDLDRGVAVRGLGPAVLGYLETLSPEDVRRAVRLYPAEAPWDDPTFPSVAGAVDHHGGILRFAPRYPLLAGQTYRLILDFESRRSEVMSGSPVSIMVPVPKRAVGDAPEVVAIYPSAAVLPANQLKLYVHFSRSMTRWDPYDHIRLLDVGSGDTLHGVFHAMRDGLWDARGTRFTAVFDPGRVKRGLANNIAFGAPLEEGRRYRLIIGDTWRDARGRRLRAAFTKEFRVGPADRERPNPAGWRVAAPAAGTRAPVVLRFDEPMDHALLTGMLAVRGSARAVHGDGRAADGEREWHFVPAQPWMPGRYAVWVDRRLEDLASNSVHRLFDMDRNLDHQTSGPDLGGEDWLALPFVIQRSAARTDTPERSHP